jgi:hypothetical protein
MWGGRVSHAMRFATPADFPRRDYRPYSHVHVRREGFGFFPRSRAILCRPVPNPNRHDSQLLHRCIPERRTWAVARRRSASLALVECFSRRGAQLQSRLRTRATHLALGSGDVDDAQFAQCVCQPQVLVATTHPVPTSRWIGSSWRPETQRDSKIRLGLCEHARKDT